MSRSTPPTIRRGAVAVIVRDGRFLVIRRSQSVSAPGKYCFPGGKIEEGETDEEAVCRETREELGCDVRPLRRLWRSVTSWGVQLAWWLVDLDDPNTLVPHPAEVESIHWLSTVEMRRLAELLESNHRFLDALEQGVIEL